MSKLKLFPIFLPDRKAKGSWLCVYFLYVTRLLPGWPLPNRFRHFWCTTTSFHKGCIVATAGIAGGEELSFAVATQKTTISEIRSLLWGKKYVSKWKMARGEVIFFVRMWRLWPGQSIDEFPRWLNLECLPQFKAYLALLLLLLLLTEPRIGNWKWAEDAEQTSLQCRSIPNSSSAAQRRVAKLRTAAARYFVCSFSWIVALIWWFAVDFAGIEESLD